MNTIIQTPEGDKFKIITKQYSTSLYVAVYDKHGIVEQFGSDMSEDDFHNKLRKDFQVIDSLD